MKIPKKELTILKHALGLSRSDKPYRNRFITDPQTVDYPHCENLVSKGLMLKRRFSLDETNESYLYQVTPLGEELTLKSLESK